MFGSASIGPCAGHAPRKMQEERSSVAQAESISLPASPKKDKEEARRKMAEAYQGLRDE